MKRISSLRNKNGSDGSGTKGDEGGEEPDAYTQVTEGSDTYSQVIEPRRLRRVLVVVADQEHLQAALALSARDHHALDVVQQGIRLGLLRRGAQGRAGGDVREQGLLHRAYARLTRQVLDAARVRGPAGVGKVQAHRVADAGGEAAFQDEEAAVGAGLDLGDAEAGVDRVGVLGAELEALAVPLPGLETDDA